LGLLFIAGQKVKGFTVKLNFQDADFWLINKHDRSEVGKPVRTFNRNYIGIKCPNWIFPHYGFYLFQYLFLQGIWKRYSHGTTNLNYLRVKDVKEAVKSIEIVQEI
jgi:hypothetical protein